jgi:Lrp/AsnC family transcriptional regulator, leucine-responsive regulatory protein
LNGTLRALRTFTGSLIDVKLQSSTSAQDFVAAATKLPGIIGLAILTGSFDVRLRVACKDQADLVSIVEALRTRLGTQETNSSLICREIEIRNWNI